MMSPSAHSPRERLFGSNWRSILPCIYIVGHSLLSWPAYRRAEWCCGRSRPACCPYRKTATHDGAPVCLSWSFGRRGTPATELTLAQDLFYLDVDAAGQDTATAQSLNLPDADPQGERDYQVTMDD